MEFAATTQIRMLLPLLCTRAIYMVIYCSGWLDVSVLQLGRLIYNSCRLGATVKTHLHFRQPPPDPIDSSALQSICVVSWPLHALSTSGSFVLSDSQQEDSSISCISTSKIDCNYIVHGSEMLSLWRVLLGHKSASQREGRRWTQGEVYVDGYNL